MANEKLTVLRRPRCRIALGEPGPEGEGWADVSPLPAPVLNYWGNAPSAATEVRALASEKALHVRFDCSIPDPARLRPHGMSSSVNDFERVCVELAPHNDFSEWRRFTVDFRGGVEASGFRRMPGEKSLETVHDVWQEPAAVRGEWHVYHGFSAGGWWAEMVIPWRLLGLVERPPAVGLNYGRFSVEDSRWPVLAGFDWTARQMTTQSLIDPGEALIGTAALAPERLDLDAPRFGWNEARLVLSGDGPTVAATLRVRTESAEGETISAEDVPIGAGAGEAAFRYRLDRRHSSHLDVFVPQRLVLELADAASGGPLYRVRLPMDRHLGLCVDEPYGEPVTTARDKTRPRREAILDRVVRALPRLRRATTRQGAPSDFCLLYADGSLAANLMADDAWPRLAAIIEDRFATTADRMVAAMALVGQKTVTNLILGPMFFNAAGEHTYHTALHEWMGPLSIMRYGGGPATARAAVLARLLREVRDPATGKPFVTRVVTFGQDGGPTQRTGPKPFSQRPGRIGAVAVDVKGGRTLLDATALAFFPREDGTPTTIAEILADDVLRNDGAGRLAAAYGKIDADEVERQPADRLLSRGVFPELCPNEEGPDAPFDPAMRYRPRTLLAAAGQESDALVGFVTLDGRAGVRDADVRLRWDDAGLRVRVTARGVAAAALQGRDREMERCTLVVDANHDHAAFRRFVLSAAGERAAWREWGGAIQTLFKNGATEAWLQEEPLDAAAWSGRFTTAGDGYEAVFELPWRALGVDVPPCVVGFNVWLEGRTPHYEQVTLSPPRWGLPSDPFRFVDAYLGNAAVTVAAVDFGLPAWGDNVAAVTLANDGAQDAAVALHFETGLAMRRGLRRKADVHVTVPAGETATAAAPYFVDPREKMNTARPQNVILVVHGDEGEVFRGRWPMAYHTAPGVYCHFGADVPPTENPAPAAPDFIGRKVRYLCGRLPKLMRLTTRDGAASDFVIRAEDGSIEFDLMAPDVLDRMGEYVAERFDTDLDRVLGMFALCCHPAVARHQSGGHRLMSGVGPVSILRGNFAGGGGNCGFHSRAFAAMLSHLKIGGLPLTAHTVGVRGHAVTGLAWRGSKAIIDADVGHFILTADGRDLATIDDLRAGAPVLSTAGDGDIVRYYTFHDGEVRFRRNHPDDDTGGVFPPGAPR